MKFNVIKEGEPLQIVEGIHYYEKLNGNSSTLEDKRIYMKLYTDGVIEKQSTYSNENILNFMKEHNMENVQVDSIRSKYIYITGHSYILTYLIGKEWTNHGSVSGWFDIVRDVNVYLGDKKDKLALRKVRKIISNIEKTNSSKEYSSVYSNSGELDDYVPRKLDENVYHLRRKR